jgi:predicted histidine transporter YuiF (NhaC family)
MLAIFFGYVMMCLSSMLRTEMTINKLDMYVGLGVCFCTFVSIAISFSKFKSYESRSLSVSSSSSSSSSTSTHEQETSTMTFASIVYECMVSMLLAILIFNVINSEGRLMLFLVTGLSVRERNVEHY